MKEYIGLIAVILSIIGHLPYITDTIKTKTKPHIFTWIIWTLITLIVFVGQWQKGGGAGSWTTGVTGLISLLITVLAVRYGSRFISKSDVIFFTCALVALIPWAVINDPTISIILLTLIDALAFLPTIRKTIKLPDSETLFTYSLNVLRHSLSIAAIATYNLATITYPIALVLMNLVMVIIISRYRLKKSVLT